MWFGGSPRQVVLSIAGLHYKVADGSLWWAAVPRSDWPAALEHDIAPLWAEPHGDRQQELVVIGHLMDAAAARAALDACLLTADEAAAGALAWSLLDDPFVV